MLQPFKHNVVWAFLAKKWRHRTILYSGFSEKKGKMEYLRRYFNRITTSYKCGTCSFDLSHKTLSNNDEKKCRFFASDYLNETMSFEMRRMSSETSLIWQSFGRSRFKLKAINHKLTACQTISDTSADSAFW